MVEQSIQCTPHGAGGWASGSSNLHLLRGAEQSCVEFFFISMQSRVENLGPYLHLWVEICDPRCVRDPVTLLAPTGYSGSICGWSRAGQCSRSSFREPAGAELRGLSSPRALSSASCLLAAWGRARGLSLVPCVHSLSRCLR